MALRDSVSVGSPAAPFSSPFFCAGGLFGSSPREVRRYSQLYWCGRANIRARRHAHDSAGISDVGAGTGCARTVRRDIGSNRHWRAQDGADDLAHGRIETAWRIRAQDYEAGLGGICRPEFTYDVVSDRPPIASLISRMIARWVAALAGSAGIAATTATSRWIAQRRHSPTAQGPASLVGGEYMAASCSDCLDYKLGLYRSLCNAPSSGLFR